MYHLPSCRRSPQLLQVYVRSRSRVCYLSLNYWPIIIKSGAKGRRDRASMTASVIERVLAEGYDLTNVRVSGGTGCLTGAGTGRG